jgi:hypothetical protein
VRWYCACAQMWVEADRPEVLEGVADLLCPVCHTAWGPVPMSEEVTHAQ